MQPGASKYFAVMKARFTDEQIAFVLGRAETGARVAGVCRKMGIREAAFYEVRRSGVSRGWGFKAA